MPLQLRRGLSTQRTSKTYAEGELVYITDTGALYIGNGTTAGGMAVANLPETTIKDFTAAMFTGGSHTGITFTYNSTTRLVNAAINIELSNYVGTIKADAFKGTLVGDDSSILVDAVSGKINLDGHVKGDIIPDANEAYDIGSSTYRFKDLYLKGTSIHLGGAVITNPSSTIIDLPAGSTIGGTAIGTNTGGVVGNFTFTANTIDIGASSAILTSTNVLPLDVKTITTGSSGGIPLIQIRASKGTIASPTTTAAGDILNGLSFAGWANGDYQSAGTILASWESTATLTDDNPASKVVLVTGAGGSSNNTFTFDSNGTFTAPSVKVGSYATLSLPSSATAGTIAFDSDTNQFKGYNGSSWVVLG